MNDDSEGMYRLFPRFYLAVKVLAAAVVSVCGVVGSVIAFNQEVNWTEQKAAIYAFVSGAFLLVLILLAFIVALTLLLKDALAGLSYFKNQSKSLKASAARLEELAHTDAVTGIGNSLALQRALSGEDEGPSPVRCLILLDLQDFGVINKRHNHWMGDEYLRAFTKKVTTELRRNEFLFKKRPLSMHTPDARAFRRNSGGDEFFVLLQGTIGTGLGYLTRLQKQREEFEKMSMEVLGAVHPFGFHAGLIEVGDKESYASVDKRVSDCLRLAQEEASPFRVYWGAVVISGRVRDDVQQLFRKTPKESRSPSA